MLARVTLEPDWREGEQDRVALLTQTVLVQTRSIMLASDALQSEVLVAINTDARNNLVSHAEEFRLRASRALEAYARSLGKNPPEARRPSTQLDALTFGMFDTHASLLEATVRLDRELTGLPDWRELSDSEVTP
jgi:multidrug resistance protein MdtO